MTNFKHAIINGEYHKVCKHCGESIALSASGKNQIQFTFSHVAKHSSGPVITEQRAK